MAHADLFKPFLDPRLGQLFFKKDMSEGFLIEVAQNECRSIFTGLQKDFPDILLSLGCGKSKRPPVPSIASNETRRTKASSRFTRSEEDDTRSYITEDSADAYAQYPRPNFISLNPFLDELPEMDDVSSIPELQSLIQEATDAEVVKSLVSQLFATLFYAETDAPVQDTTAGEVLIPGMYWPFSSVSIKCSSYHQSASTAACSITPQKSKKSADSSNPGPSAIPSSSSGKKATVPKSTPSHRARWIR